MFETLSGWARSVPYCSVIVLVAGNAALSPRSHGTVEVTVSSRRAGPGFYAAARRIDAR
jgi:hypothetical protein